MSRIILKVILAACLFLLASNVSLTLAETKTPRSSRAVKIHSISIKSYPQADEILVRSDAPIDRVKAFFMKNPHRIVVDFYNCEYFGPLAPKKRRGRFIRLPRFGRHKNKVRFAADLAEGVKVQPYISRKGNTLSIYLGRPQTQYIERISAAMKPPGSLDVKIITNKKTALLYKVFSLSQPNRLIFDLPDTFSILDLPKKMNVKGAEGLSIRVGSHPKFTRVVVDLGPRPIPEFQITPEPKGVLISLQFLKPSPVEVPPKIPEGRIEITPPEEPTGVIPKIEGERPAEPELREDEIGFKPQEEKGEDTWKEIGKGSPFEFHGKLWNKFALDIKEDTRFEDDKYNHAELKLEVKYLPNRNVQLVLGGEIDHFAYENLGDWDYDDDIRPYNAYINWAGSGFNLRVGNQIVRWGKTDQISPLDNVNPEDLRDGIIRRRDERKLPIPMVNLELNKDPYTLQGILIPFFIESELDLAGADWAFFQHVAEEFGTFTIAEDNPPNTLENIEFGVRFSGTVRNLNYAISYLYSREDTPSPGPLILPPGISPAPSSATIEDLARFALANGQQFRLEHDRQSIVGLEFETKLGEIGIRTDIAYIYRKRFITTELGNLKKHVFQYAMGTDFNVLDSLYLNFEFYQAFILDYDDKILFSDEDTSGFYGEISGKIFIDDLKLDLRYLYSVTDEDYYLNPNIQFDYRRHLGVEVGADILGGPRNKNLGWFRDNDQIYLILEIDY